MIIYVVKILLEGFALLYCRNLMATSLSDGAFDACLRLCLLEDALDPGGAGSIFMNDIVGVLTGSMYNNKIYDLYI